MTDTNALATDKVHRFPAPSREELLRDDENRIATLTTSAIMQAGEKAARDVLQSVAQLEGLLKIIREDAEQLAGEIKRHTETHATRVGKVIEGLRELSASMAQQRATLIETQQPKGSNSRAAE